MSRVAYLDVVAGAAGDMIMAACADASRLAGADADDQIRRAVHSLQLDADVEFEEARRAGLRCLVARVTTPRHTYAPDELAAAIERADASDRARETAGRCLRELVRAEAQVHGVGRSEVHFHELGSADTAVDLLGAAVGLEALGADHISASPVPMPRGIANTQHGKLPMPVPVTLALLSGVPVFGVEDDFELVTPTAVAILTGHRAAFGPLPAMTFEEVGVGGGTADRANPNVCRLLLGSPIDALATKPGPASAIPQGVRRDHDVLLECNIDDQTPEMLADALAALMDAGAKDAWITPIVMKKSRPAFMLSVLLDPEHEGVVLAALFRHTSTLGTRRRETAKWVLDRETLSVPVRGTNVRVKVGRMSGEPVTVSPEYDDCSNLARRLSVPVDVIYREALDKARRTLGS